MQGDREEDIYLLDIELPDGNGLEVAKCIRERDERPFLIYITNYIQYAVAAFEVNTFRYINKAMLTQNLPKAYQSLQIMLEKREKQEKFYLIDSCGKTVKIRYRDIIYLKKENKYVKVVCINEEYRIRKSLAEVTEEMDCKKMVMIERGYVVNLKHVTLIKDHQVYLSDGTVLLVARARWKTVREIFLKTEE